MSDLVTRIQQGDADALHEIVRQHYVSLTQFAQTFLHSIADAEDVVQDVFAKIWITRATWQPQSISAYLFAAVRNRALHIVEHRKIVQQSEQNLMTEQSHTVVNDNADVRVTQQEQRALYHQLMNVLTERQQTVIRLRYEQGLKFSDIATALGVSDRAAQQLLGRALRTLYERAAAMELDRP